MATNTPTPPVPTPAPAPTPPSTPPAPAQRNCNCGPLVPQPGEQPIPLGTSGDAILSQIQLEVDNETGVFFFRSKSRLYQRIVKVS